MPLSHSIRTPDYCEETVGLEVAGQRLAGILTLPAKGQAQEVVVFSHGWGGNRNGPHNLLTHLSRQIAKRGVAAFRFDFRGRGESGGATEAATLATMAEDLVAATSWCRSRGFATVHFSGICSGGNVIIGALPRLAPAGRLVLFSVYPFSDGDDFGRQSRRLAHNLGEYRRKFFRRETWAKLVRGEIQFGAIAKILFAPFRSQQAAKKREGELKPVPGAGDGSEASKRFLRHLSPELPTLMLYGDRDPESQASLKYYQDYARNSNLPIDFLVIPRADHNFSSQAWGERACQAAVDFLEGEPIER